MFNADWGSNGTPIHTVAALAAFYIGYIFDTAGCVKPKPLI